MNGFRNGKLYTKKLNLVGAVIRYSYRDLRWKDMYLMGMNHLQAKEFQVALDARTYFSWSIEAYMAGIKCVSVKQAMLKYSQALKNLERLEQNVTASDGIKGSLSSR